MPEQTHSFVGFPLFSTGIPLVKQHCDELLDDYQEASVERRRSLWRNELCLAGHSSYLLGFSSQLLGSDHSSQFCFASHLLFFTVAFTHSCFYSQLLGRPQFAVLLFLSVLSLTVAFLLHSCFSSSQCFSSQMLFFFTIAFLHSCLADHSSQ